MEYGSDEYKKAVQNSHMSVGICQGSHTGSDCDFTRCDRARALLAAHAEAETAKKCLSDSIANSKEAVDQLRAEALKWTETAADYFRQPREKEAALGVVVKELDWLAVDATNFMARVRESWDHFNVNNYEKYKDHATWRALDDLGKRLSGVETLLSAPSLSAAAARVEATDKALDDVKTILTEQAKWCVDAARHDVKKLCERCWPWNTLVYINNRLAETEKR